MTGRPAIASIIVRDGLYTKAMKFVPESVYSVCRTNMNLIQSISLYLIFLILFIKLSFKVRDCIFKGIEYIKKELLPVFVCNALNRLIKMIPFGLPDIGIAGFYKNALFFLTFNLVNTLLAVFLSLITKANFEDLKEAFSASNCNSLIVQVLLHVFVIFMYYPKDYSFLLDVDFLRMRTFFVLSLSMYWDLLLQLIPKDLQSISYVKVLLQNRYVSLFLCSIIVYFILCPYFVNVICKPYSVQLYDPPYYFAAIFCGYICCLFLSCGRFYLLIVAMVLTRVILFYSLFKLYYAYEGDIYKTLETYASIKPQL